MSRIFVMSKRFAWFLTPALAVMLSFASTGTALAKIEAKAEAEASAVRVLLVPPTALGEVRPLLEKRIAKALQDAMSFSTRMQALSDRDRAAPPPVDKKTIVQVKGSASARRIDEADLQRQEGTDFAAEAKHGQALAKLREAIAGYEQSYLELVDYTKLADAYARAGLAAFLSGAGVGEAERLFVEGITLQPTLVIDRRKQPKELLDLFESVHARLAKAPKLAIAVEGTAAGAEVFIDGVKVGPLPARLEGLVAGTHYVQVRGTGWQPWGQVVRLRKEAKIDAKILPTKGAATAPAEPELSVEALDPCGAQGNFHADICKGRAVRLAKQTGAQFLAFVAIKADRYGRLTLHPFAMEGSSGATVALKPIELAADLGDLNAKVATWEAELDTTVQAFPKARALTKAPTVYKEK